MIDSKNPYSHFLFFYGGYWNYKNLDFGLVSKGESLHNDLAQYNNPERLDSELMNMIAKG